jgi:hypothetical protein
MLTAALKALAPDPLYQKSRELAAENRLLKERLDAQDVVNFQQQQFRLEEYERAAELVEAQQMRGSGPWLVAEVRQDLDKPGKFREVQPTTSQGAFGDMELALQNVEWRRELNLSWLEFSRWGIQQIILISRLYYIKNPLIRRLIDISATYVFGRGVEVTSSDEDANEVLQEFFERNQQTLGQIALVDLERRKYYDGNLFFCFFVDKLNTGKTSVRTIDATEIQDIICDPDDTDMPWFYRRSWVQRIFDPESGSTTSKSCILWYPALGYEPEEQIAELNGIPIQWENPILHRKDGAVAKWHFGCPRIYPALDWAKSARKYLEACSTVKLALARFAAILTTKGGQQAIAGAKQQLETTVGPGTPLWDKNPTPVNASIMASGPGTTFEFLNATGKGGDPEEVRQYKLMCCIVVGVPETFLADVSTGNLATATTLDRPTELVFAERQEAWREDLARIAKYVLMNSLGAASGQLKEAMDRRRASGFVIMERARRLDSRGRMVYVWEKADLSRAIEAKKKTKKPEKIQVTVTFPAIREGDLPAVIGALSTALTLNNKGGQIVGIDEKTGILMMLRELGYEDAEDLIELMYPTKEYDPDRTKEPEAAPIMPVQAAPNPGGQPQATPAAAANAPPQSEQPGNGVPTKQAESLLAVASRLSKTADQILKRDGHSKTT